MMLSLARVLLASLFLVFANSVSANLLDNPGFEQDFLSWNDWGNGFIDTSTVHSGAKAARIGPAEGGRAQQVTSLVAGTEYTMCAWSRVDAVTNLSWMGVNIYDDTVTLIGNHQWEIAWTNWQQNSVTFTYPATGDYIDVWVWSDTTSDPTYVDDFTLVQGSSCAGGNSFPVAAFSASSIGLSATFTDASTDGDGSIASWLWDFGDGNNSSAQNPVHAYASPGSYSVQLTVTDNEGATGNTSQNVSVQNGTATVAYPFPQHLDYAPGTISPSHRSQAQLDNDVRAFYDYWKASFLVAAGTTPGGDPMYRVTFGSGNPGSTVSEGQGFGMMIVATMAGYDPAAKTYFDGLWEFVNANPSIGDPRLMDWQVPENSGNNSAFDGDADIAYGLLLADAQWGSGGSINYAADAAMVIAGILDSTIGPASDLPMLGDWVNPSGSPHSQYTPRSSDFMPGHFRAYGRATDDASWDLVVSSVQAVIDSIQANHSPVTGLLPDFIVGADATPQPAPAGFLEGANDGNYNYNAGRDPWRIGADALLNNDSGSLAQTRKIANWIFSSSGGNPANIEAGYELDGTPLDTYFTTFFAAPMGVAAMTEPSLQQFLNDIYDSVYDAQEDYYSDSVNLLSMLVMSRNFWDPTTISNGSLEVMSWVPVYAIPQAQAVAQSDFGSCDAVDGLSRVGLQFWTPNNDGTIKYADHEFYTPVDSDVTWWKNWAAANGIEVYLTIYNNDGSWNWPLARSAFATNRATFVAALVAEMDRLGLDGIDLDLEGIDGDIIGSDRSNFDQFVHDLWLETSARDKGLTINSFPYIWNAPNQDWWGDWVGEVDNIHSMGYENLYEGGTNWNQYSFQQNTGIAAGHSAETVSMGMPGWMSSWGASSGRGTSAQAHVQEIRHDLAQATGIAVWDLQLTAWQDSSLWCEIQALKNSGTPQPPAAPNGLSASAFSSSAINLDWNDNAGDEDGYKVERSSNGTGSWTEVADLAADTTAWQNGSLSAATTWYYRVYAYNGSGNSGNSNTDSATTFTIPRTIQFSGRSWTVKGSGSPVGPGPNFFGDTSNDVWVDGSGFLHLRIEFRDGNWHSSEVITDEVLGHGTYTFTLGSRVDLLDRHIVVGLFTWDSFAPEFNYREIDIEFAQWGDPINDNSQYVVQPWDTAGNTLRWDTALTGSDSTHGFTWRPDQVEFSSFQGDPPAAQIQSWTYSGADVPPEGTTSGNARINFWLMGGSAPFDGQEAELVVKSFDFTPLPANNPPGASFSDSCIVLDCNFTDTSTDIDGSIASWSWDFGDSAGSSSQHPSHSYASDGSYTVELTVTDNEGATDVTSKLVVVSTPPPFVDVVANAEIPGSGSVSGGFANTHDDDGTEQSVTERESGGRKQNRYSFLVHTWQFNLPANAMATVHANAWSGGSSDDNFRFSWSSDNSNYTEMFTVSSTDSNNMESFPLPNNTEGTFYIRVEDTDQTPGNRTKDTVFVDHLYVRADSGAGNPPAAPSVLLASATGSSSIDLDWTDNANDESGFKVERSTDGASYAEIATTAANDSNFSDTALSPSMTYWYRVYAFNGSGNSADSNTDSATTDAGPAISLSLNGYKIKGKHNIDLGWSGTTTANVDIFRDGALHETVPDTGAFTDATSNKGGRTYEYQVCEAVVTGNCSAVESVSF